MGCLSIVRRMLVLHGQSKDSNLFDHMCYAFGRNRIVFLNHPHGEVAFSLVPSCLL